MLACSLSLKFFTGNGEEMGLFEGKCYKQHNELSLRYKKFIEKCAKYIKMVRKCIEKYLKKCMRVCVFSVFLEREIQKDKKKREMGDSVRRER